MGYYSDSYHSHGEYAEQHHSHREVDDVRYDIERAVSDVRDDLNHRISEIRDDNETARQELWTDLTRIDERLERLERLVAPLLEAEES
jgi:polyhydroxyalkanoate synthesis regulator phasin